MKTFLLSFAVAVLTVLSAPIQAQVPIDTARLFSAQYRLDALRQMDKFDLTDSERKAWRREKRLLRRIISDERSKAEDAYWAANAWRYNPWAWGPAPYWGWYGNRWYRPAPPVIIVQPRPQVHPRQQMQPVSRQQVQPAPRPQARPAPRQAVPPSARAPRRPN
ncbi:MAG: hypothetical protein OHK0039_33750 [Bacteroidia bacterium]